MRAALILALVVCATSSFGSERRFEISKKTQANSPIKFTLTTHPDRQQDGSVLVEMVLPTEQQELEDLWKVYLWVAQDGKTVLGAPLDLIHTKDKSIIVRFHGQVDTVRRCLVAVRCGKHAPLNETVYQIDVGSYIQRDRSMNGLSVKSLDGTTLIANQEIVSYDWKSHTITLKPGVRKRLSKRLAGDLVGGRSFEVTANGTALYRGKFTSSELPISLDAVVINLHPIDKSLSDDQIRIELGYPSRQFFKRDDPRNVEGIREALEAANMLKETN